MNSNHLRNVRYLPLGFIGALLIGWAGFHLTISPKAQACTQQDCSNTWNVVSSSCDDLFQCGCGSNCTATQNTCYRERGYCNGSSPSNDVIFRKCYLGLCTCPTGGSGGCAPPLPTAGQCLGWSDFINYPSTGCITGLFFQGPCTRTAAFRSRCNDPGYDPDSCDCPGGMSMSPIIIDVDHSGFSLTDAAGGVVFNILNDGVPLPISWTAASSSNAFLVLDRNGNGTIDSGEELFGDLTPQPSSAAPNGFLALAEYDKPGNGGNGNGRIDGNDTIFSQLRLWQDANHNGISESSELHPLAGLISAMDLDYKESRRTDQYGNQFRYRARVYDLNGVQAGRWAWDVFVKVQ